MTGTRNIHKVIKSKPTLEGAGVHLNRVFGNNEVALFARSTGRGRSSNREQRVMDHGSWEKLPSKRMGEGKPWDSRKQNLSF